VSVLSRREAEALEALTDDRIAALPADAVPAELVAALEAGGWLDAGRRGDALLELETRAAARVVEWASQTTTQGEVLAAFTEHCRDELDDVDVVEAATGRLTVRWRTEESSFELRNGFLGVDRLATGRPTMLLGDTEHDLDRLVMAFLDRPELRAKLAICDLGRLERLGTVRSSAFVYLEWFLRDAYGVKLLPVPAFTRGLIDRGVISLGMG
jgi:hypothetical protein